MIVIQPPRELKGSITIPGSKYWANRMLALAALAQGTSQLENVPENNDIDHALYALEAFGVTITKEKGSVVITGTNGILKKPKQPIDVGESGTLLRLTTSLAALAQGKTVITGSNRIKERPILPLLQSLQELGVTIEPRTTEHAPFTVIGGTYKGGKTNISGDISSQFISALLLIAPYAQEKVTIEVHGNLVSKHYVDLTIKAMQQFGVTVKRKAHTLFSITPPQHYQAQTFSIPGDWSSASYFMAAAAIAPGEVILKGLNLDEKSGEAQFVTILENMGCTARKTKNMLQVIGPHKLKGITVDMGTMPDVVPTLAAVAVFANSVTRITNIHQLRYKESDRITALQTELKKIGTDVETTENEIIIKPKRHNQENDGEEDNRQKTILPVINPHNDHRIAMSLALLGLRGRGVKIKNHACVNKSFPRFWKMLDQIGAKVMEDK
ncbi:3-phosphoshikimate 1-carboxyvinyltransferase [Candidatus Woesearchaeota archaeon]|nr:3-phosphoshikimate 1-carboxyvinyltransferase [Candidatus Woesearchaeota archaeon]